ncbi:MAG: tetratricopeptide repeat protein, partial [Acidobacteria bacterium]|nr:tetratricopeptide repeat protein [Acidobacteriota bacterium]
YTLGVTYWQQGNLREAENQLRGAVREKPDYAEAHYTLGTVLRQAGKLQDAVVALRRAIALDPGLIGAHTTLAAVLRQQGEARAADEENHRAQDLLKQSNRIQAATFNTNSGKKLLEAGDLDAAISQFRAAVTLAPDYALAHRKLAEALDRKGEKAQAQEEFRRATELGADQKREPSNGP